MQRAQFAEDVQPVPQQEGIDAAHPRAAQAGVLPDAVQLLQHPLQEEEHVSLELWRHVTCKQRFFQSQILKDTLFGLC